MIGFLVVGKDKADLVEKECRLRFWACGAITEHSAWPMSAFHDFDTVVAHALRRRTLMAADLWERLATAVDFPKTGLFSTAPLDAKGLTKIRVRRAPREKVLECRDQRPFKTTVDSSDDA